jgi:hypothetical protein
LKALHTFRRQLDGFGCRVQCPSQDQLARGPYVLSFQHFLDAGRFLAIRVVGAEKRPKYKLQGFEEGSLDMTLPLRVSLNHRDKIVHIHIVHYDWTCCLICHWHPYSFGKGR